MRAMVPQRSHESQQSQRKDPMQDKLQMGRRAQKVLRLKVAPTLLQIMAAQNLKDFAYCFYCPASSSCWAIFFKIEISAF